jgi:pimeloyl-ACP methyl ester carboxylesterase
MVMKSCVIFFISVSIFSSIGFCQIVRPASTIVAKEKYVTVDGHRMHYQVAGTGSPTVVFECGVTDDLNSWNPVFSEVSRFTQTVSYDRMGLGSSDTATTPRSFKQMAEDLHSLLHNAQLLPPYILVGHSMAGGILRAFAHLYRDEIAGMVFVDCMTEYDVTDFPKDSIEKNLPPESVSKRSTPQESELYFLRTEVLTGFPELRSFSPLPNVPVHVFVGQKNIFPAVVNNRIEWYRRAVSNQTVSSLTVLPESSHYIQRDYPGLIVSAIHQMLFSNAETELREILLKKGVDSCIAYYKKMKNSYPAGMITEGLLNKLGYDAMSRGDIKGAIKLFSLNAMMYPNSFNTYDSMGEAYLNAGNKKEAIKDYQKSLQLNPANKNAERMLNKIKTIK